MISISCPMKKSHTQHTSASVAPTPHREHRRERDHVGRRHRQNPDGTLPNVVLSPGPAHPGPVHPGPVHYKNGRRPTERRDIEGSVQPIAPGSKRPSHGQPRDVQPRDSNTSHPYTSPNYNNRTVPNPITHMNGGSESLSYGQRQAGKNGTGGETIADPGRGFVGEDGGHGRKPFWRNLFCCVVAG